MAVDLQQAAWLKAESLSVLAVPASGVAWGPSRAVDVEFTSPIDAVADALTEAGRTIAFLAGPNVKERVVVKGRRRDLLLKCVSIEHPRLGRGERVVNGTFDSSIANWTNSGAIGSWSAGALRVTTTGSAQGVSQQGVPTIPGVRHLLTGDVIADTSGTGGAIYPFDPVAGYLAFPIAPPGGKISQIITPTSATITLQAWALSSTNGQYQEYDNISLRALGEKVFVVGVAENDNGTTTLTVLRKL